MVIELINGNRGARIAKNDGLFYTILLVNVRNGLRSANVADGESAKTHSTEAGARRWAAKYLAS